MWPWPAAGAPSGGRRMTGGVPLPVRLDAVGLLVQQLRVGAPADPADPDVPGLDWASEERDQQVAALIQTAVTGDPMHAAMVVTELLTMAGNEISAADPDALATAEAMLADLLAQNLTEGMQR